MATPMRLSKAALLQQLVAQAQLSPRQAAGVYHAVLEVTLSALQAGQRVTWPGLGTFELVEVPELSGVNGRTGERVVRPAGVKVVFTRSAALGQPGWFDEDGGRSALDQERVRGAALMHRREYPASLAEFLELLDTQG